MMHFDVTVNRDSAWGRFRETYTVTADTERDAFATLASSKPQWDLTLVSVRPTVE